MGVFPSVRLTLPATVESGLLGGLVRDQTDLPNCIIRCKLLSSR